MRLLISLAIEKPSLLPYEQGELLQAAVYRFLETANPAFARTLHDIGYTRVEDASRRFKLFCFTTLRFPRSRRETIPQGILVHPGIAEWIVASPRIDFLEHYATGLLQTKVLTLGNLQLPVREVRMLPTPDFARYQDPLTGLAEARFTCLTPVVASVPVEGRETAYYLRPGEDADRFREQVRQNLLKKHALVHNGSAPERDEVRLVFDAGYLARDKQHGTKKTRFKNTDHVGAVCPFTLTADPAMLALAWDCGLGEKSSMGYGMIGEL